MKVFFFIIAFMILANSFLLANDDLIVDDYSIISLEDEDNRPIKSNYGEYIIKRDTVNYIVSAGFDLGNSLNINRSNTINIALDFELFITHNITLNWHLSNQSVGNNWNYLTNRGFIWGAQLMREFKDSDAYSDCIDCEFEDDVNGGIILASALLFVLPSGISIYSDISEATSYAIFANPLLYTEINGRGTHVSEFGVKVNARNNFFNFSLNVGTRIFQNYGATFFMGMSIGFAGLAK